MALAASSSSSAARSSTPSSGAGDTTMTSNPATPVKRAASPIKKSPSKMPKTISGQHLSSTTVGASASASKQNVVVCVRVRPAAPPAAAAKGKNEDVSGASCWALDAATHTITATEQHPAIAKRGGSSFAPASLPHATSTTGGLADAEEDSSNGAGNSGSYKFSFDSLTVPDESSSALYEQEISPIIRAAIEGYNATVFAYGQTGSGKTHTMSGSKEELGIIPRAVHEIFEGIQKEQTREHLLRVSYLEIYNESLKDLLAALPGTSSAAASSSKSIEANRPASPTKGGSSHSAGVKDSQLRIIEDKGRVMITGLCEEIVTDPEMVLKLIEDGQRMRHVGATDWNERSSRSHCVFQITIESKAKACSSSAEGGGETRLSQLNLIDLAGSERAATQKARRKEGAFINKSLLTLGTVIAKLTEACSEDGSSNSTSASDPAHIPYRDSKLTRILQTSLGGNARVAVICTISPDPKHAIESLSTLKFGRRCKMVVTSAKKGTIMDDKALLQKYKSELDALKAKLEAGPSASASHDAIDEEMEKSILRDLTTQKELGQKEMEEMQQQKLQLRGQIDHLTKLILTSKKISAEEEGGFEDASADAPIRPLPRRGPRLSELPPRGSPMTGLAKRILPEAKTSITEEDSFATERELAAVKRQLRRAEADAQAKEAELSDQKARVAELEAGLGDREEALARLEQDRDTDKRGFAQGNEEAERIRQELESERKATQLLREELLTAKNRADELESAAQEHRAKLEETATKHREEVEREKKYLAEQVDRLRDELDLKTAETKKLLAAVPSEEAKEEEAKLRAQLVKAELKNERLSLELTQAQEAERKAKEQLKNKASSNVGKDSKPLPVPTLGQARGSNHSPAAIRDSNFWSKAPIGGGGSLPGSPLRAPLKSPLFSPPQNRASDLFSADAKGPLQRAGSLREYRKYEPTRDDSPLPTGPSGLSYNPSSAVIDAALRAEREEITRLNAVIASQRSLMTDLEKSVAQWKNKMRLQQDLINRLAAEPEEMGPSHLPRSPIPEKYHIDSPEKAARLFKESQLLASPALSSLTSRINQRDSHPEDLFFAPYQAASTHNRSSSGSTAGLGLAPGSPSKGSGWFTALPGQFKPEPLPLHPDSPHNGDSPRRRPRKTLEGEIDMLRSTSRVDRTKSQLLNPVLHSPSKLGKADLAAIRGNNARSTKDYYV